MPLLTSPCADLVDPCCTTLGAFADHLRCEALDAIMACFEPGSCEPFTSYVSMGAGDDGIADSLIVSVNTMLPSANTTSVGFSLWNMTFDVRLRESGYPMVQTEGSQIVLPDPQLQHQATMQLMAHGEAIHRRLSALKTKRQLAPTGYQCLQGTIGSLLPLTPQGGVAGWSILVTVQMPWG